MNIKNFKVKDLREAEYNPRVRNDKFIKSLEKSIDKFGLVEPLVVNTHKCDKCGNRYGIVVGGNQRLYVLIKKKIEETEVTMVDLHLDEEKALNVMLNSIVGDWDLPKLAMILDELPIALTQETYNLGLSSLLWDSVKKIRITDETPSLIGDMPDISPDYYTIKIYLSKKEGNTFYKLREKLNLIQEELPEVKVKYYL